MARRKFTREFKLSAVQLVNQQGYSVPEAAKSLGVDPNCVRGWVEKLGGEVQASPGSEGAMASELRRLRKENGRLLMERDILKKAAAFFAREQPRSTHLYNQTCRCITWDFAVMYRDFQALMPNKKWVVAESRVSPGAREMLRRLGIVEDFAGAAEDAKRIANVPVCKERLRQIVEAEGAKVTQVRQEGDLKATWTQAEAVVEGTDKTRVYGGIDGVMAPMVTQAEKDKRRKEQVIRRQKRAGQGLKNTRPLPAAQKGHDEKYREMKIGVFYDQDKTHRHCFATAKRWEGFAALLKIYAGQVDFAKAFEALTLTDGAKWIVSAICMALSYVKATLLDFYHLSQHVHQAAKACLGETPQALEWAKARLEEIKEQGVKPVLLAIGELDKKVRSPAKKKQLRLLREYLTKRLEMLDYKGALAKGWDIGSGPTEAMCKNLTLRLKRTGMKWDARNAEALMNLTALYESGQKSSYWSGSYRRKAA